MSSLNATNKVILPPSSQTTGTTETTETQAPGQVKAPEGGKPGLERRISATGVKSLASKDNNLPHTTLDKHTAIVEPPIENSNRLEISVGKRGSITVVHAPGGKRNSLKLEGQKALATPLRAAIDTKMPNDAEFKLNAWFVKNDAKLRKSNDQRVHYSQTEIGPSLKRFQDTFGCDWQKMKHGCTDTEKDTHFMQVINDLRSMYLEEIFADLKKEHPNLTIDDFGSTKLTSDRDFALGGFGEDRQTMNTLLAKKFNAKFEAIWKAPSATVFDSNAYTSQHIMRASDPGMEQQRSNLQHEGSLLMKLRNGTPQSWENFKKAAIDQIADPGMRQAQLDIFARVENVNKDLQLKLNQEVLKLALAGSHSIATKDTLGKLADTPAHKLTEREITDINTAAAAIKGSDPHIEIQASNTLYEQIKTGYGELERDRLDLFSTLKNLDKLSGEGNQVEFVQTFNIEIDSFIADLQEQLGTETDKGEIAHLESHIAFLQNAKINNETGKEVMQAYKDRSGIEKAEKDLHDQRIELEGQLAQFKKLDQRMKDITSSAGGTIAELRKAESALDQLKSQYGVRTIGDISSYLASEITKIDNELKRVRSEKDQLAEKHGEFWDQAGVIGKEGDRLLIDIQKSHLRGMCFAQEAHVAEGAIGFVVFNIQAGKADVRTLEQYSQAFLEISAYFSGHQLREATPHGSAVEASKYGDRLGQAIDHINERAKALNIPPPALNGAQQLTNFFQKVTSLRGTKKSDSEIEAAVTKLARETGIIGKDDHFDAAALTRINEQMDVICGSIEAWLKVSASNQRNAYY